MVVKKVDAVTEHVAKKIATASQVTSPPKKLNARDQFVAWISSFIMTIVIFVTSIWSIIAAILDSIADYLLPYLQQVPRGDRPAWLALLAFIGMGIVILNKRRLSGPGYKPPVLPQQTWQPPSQPSPPAPQGQPVPPGQAPDTSKTAF